MLITDVTTIKLSYDMPVAMADAIHYMPNRLTLLVQVHTDEGFIGLGEAAVYGGFPESIEAIILGELRQTILGQEFATLLNMEIGEPKREFTAMIPLGRIEQPEDVAGIAAFLASSDADYMTQQCINVDGGNWPS